MTNHRSSLEILKERIREGEEYVARLKAEGKPCDRSVALLSELKIQAVTLSERCPPPIIWENGNKQQMLSVLVLKEADLVRLKAQLTGDPEIDWWAKNEVRNLELHIADIKRWLAESEELQK